MTCMLVFLDRDAEGDLYPIVGIDFGKHAGAIGDQDTRWTLKSAIKYLEKHSG